MSRMRLGFFCVYVFWVRLGCVRLIAVIMQLYVTATTGTRNANTVNLCVCVCWSLRFRRFGVGAGTIHYSTKLVEVWLSVRSRRHHAIMCSDPLLVCAVHLCFSLLLLLSGKGVDAWMSLFKWWWRCTNSIVDARTHASTIQATTNNNHKLVPE